MTKRKPRLLTVFLSHHSADKPFVRRLAVRLVENGARVWLDEGNLHIRDPFPNKIGTAIYNSDFVIAVISRNSLRSKWFKKELSIAVAKEATTGRRVVLPVLIGRCRIPSFLSDKLSADFTEPDHFDASADRLLKAMGLSIDRKQYRSGVAIEWTSEGPRIFGHDTVIPVTEANDLLDRWREWLPKFIDQEEKCGRPRQDVVPAAQVLAVIRACADTYNRVPDEAEMKVGKTELSRKLDLLYLFFDAMLEEASRNLPT